MFGQAEGAHCSSQWMWRQMCPGGSTDGMGPMGSGHFGAGAAEGRTVTVESLPWKYNSVDQSTAVFASQLPTEHGAPGLEKGSQCSLPSWAAPGWEPSTKRGPAGQQGNTSDEQAAFC